MPPRNIDSKDYLANPAKGERRAKNAVPEDGNSRRAAHPAPTRQDPAKPGTLAQTWQARLNSAREIRARWFNTPPRPLPPEVLKRVGAVPEIHGLQGCWNMAGNRLPPEDLARLLEALEPSS